MEVVKKWVRCMHDALKVRVKMQLIKSLVLNNNTKKKETRHDREYNKTTLNFV